MVGAFFAGALVFGVLMTMPIGGADMPVVISLYNAFPGLAVGLGAGVLAISGLPPFGVFMSEFLIITTTFAREPWLAVVLAFGLLVAFGALLWRLQELIFGEPTEPAHRVEASSVPLIVHLALVLIAGLYLPPTLVSWFQRAAELLG